ncbi:ATP-binding protein [bacterium]|nr:ATP-binding protein [bacterium]
MIEDAFSDNFTLFVLGVSIVLSFVLRRLINEIQLLKESYSKDLMSFTEKIVEEHPSLEQFYRLALLFYQNKNYSKANQYLNKLLGEEVFEKEAKFYLILTLVELGKLDQAKVYLSSLDFTLYSKREVMELKQSVRKSRYLYLLKEWLVNVLLTRVPLQLSYSKDLSSNKEVQIVAALPTRYTQTSLKSQNQEYYIFEAQDQHLSRDVELWVFKKDELANCEMAFLELPKILANLHSRSFPEVYDLQQGSLVFYSREKLEGLSFYDHLNQLQNEKKIAECFSLWISLFSQVEFLELNQLALKDLDFSSIGYHSKKECLFIVEKVDQFEEANQQTVLENLQGSFMAYIVKLLEKYPQEFEGIQEYFLRLSFENYNLKQSIHLIENLLQEFLKETRSDIKDLLQQLNLLEEIHRSCIHGLKGKFSVYQRYLYAPEKLLKTFYRDLNIDDVQMKMKHLIQKVEELKALPKLQVFSLTEEMLAADFAKIRQKMLDYKEDLGSVEGDKGAEYFLQTQSVFFSNLSGACSSFFKDHEYDLEEGIYDFVKASIEKESITVSMDSQLMSKKIRVIQKSQFESEISLLFENAVNNSFEAGAKNVCFYLFKKSSQEIRLEIVDDGPGITQEILDEFNDLNSYQLSLGGTGLLAIRNSCNIIGAHLELKNIVNQGCSLSIDLPSFRN